MCYSTSMSLALGALGIATAIYLITYKPKLKYKYVLMVLLFYTVMEFLQAIQYLVVNKCDLFWNKLLTEFAYLLVILQPLMWNFFFYMNTSSPQDKRIFELGIAFSILWLVFNVFGRFMYGKTDSQTREMSVFAGKEVCTKKKASHLYWEWTSGNLMDYTATYLWYLLLWFVPPLLVAEHRWTACVLMFSALMGGWMTYVAGEPQIFASAWCYISVPMILLMVFVQQVTA